jgi:hypothetical protein
MIIHVDHMTEDEVNRINMHNALVMLGIDTVEVDARIAAREAEAAAEKKAADEAKRARFVKAIEKLKKIRLDIINKNTDVKVGSKIGIDGFMFIV